MVLDDRVVADLQFRCTVGIAVSYTHLDVYKRQQKDRAVLGEVERVAPLAGGMALLDVELREHDAVDAERFVKGGGGVHGVPVSYTHLDVYKRQ